MLADRGMRVLAAWSRLSVFFFVVGCLDVREWFGVNLKQRMLFKVFQSDQWMRPHHIHN